jgi:predicted cupin superfamily sugar epimerase
MADARELIARLALAPHPEGGWYRETWRAEAVDGERAAGTSILFLLDAGQRSHWHRVDASELWIFQAGTPLALSTADGAHISSVRLGVDVVAGDRPQHVVQPHQWQAARAGAGWCLVACVVVPAFRFEGFELAPAGWSPDHASHA